MAKTDLQPEQGGLLLHRRQFLLAAAELPLQGGLGHFGLGAVAHGLLQLSPGLLRRLLQLLYLLLQRHLLLADLAQGHLCPLLLDLLQGFLVHGPIILCHIHLAPQLVIDSLQPLVNGDPLLASPLLLLQFLKRT